MTSFIRRIAAFGALAALFAAGHASAHTIAIGTVNAGAPGSVTIWLGSYHTGAPNEGSLTLNGVTQAFNLLAAALPAGLVVGDNYFFAPGTGGATGQYDQSVNTTGLSVTRWQGVTFTGLAAGAYSYTVSGMFSVDYADWNSSTSNWTGRLTIPESSVNVPEPASLALMGLALVGLALGRRRRA